MSAYYNEINPEAAAWLRELIKQGLIADGEVDERSIEDVTPNEILGFTQCHFFAGIGVWSYALRNAGWGDDRPVWTGSCPCQPFSAAGKGKGFADERHLWPAFFHLIENVRPLHVFGEQVASKDGLAWIDLVQADMEGTGYAFGEADTCAAGFGAPHIRQRLWFVAERLAYAKSLGLEGGWGSHGRGSAEGIGERGYGLRRSGVSSTSGPSPTNSFWRDADRLFCRDGKWRPVEPGTFPLAHGAPARVGRLRGYGNAIVAAQAQAFVEAFMEIEG